MSADNGIYIGEFPTSSGGKEYRVTEAAAIDNCFDQTGYSKEDTDDYRARYFGKATVFYDLTEAEMYAFDLSRKNWTEYGVQYLEFDRPLNLTNLTDTV